MLEQTMNQNSDNELGRQSELCDIMNKGSNQYLKVPLIKKDKLEWDSADYYKQQDQLKKMTECCDDEISRQVQLIIGSKINTLRRPKLIKKDKSKWDSGTYFQKLHFDNFVKEHC